MLKTFKEKELKLIYLKYIKSQLEILNDLLNFECFSKFYY